MQRLPRVHVRESLECARFRNMVVIGDLSESNLNGKWVKS